MNDRMTVVYTSSHITDQYLPTALNSLFTHNPNTFVYIITESNKIDCVKETENIKIISKNQIPDFSPIIRPNNNILPMQIVRCWLPKILKEDKILYLDIDTLVLDSLEELWNTDITNYAIAAWAEDLGEKREYFVKPRRRMKKSMYVNSGVMLMNLDFIRQNKLDDKQINLLQTEWFPLPDQDVINITCDGYIKYLPSKYNFGSLNKNPVPIEDVKIYHMTLVKYWGNSNQNHKYYYLWEKYYKENYGYINNSPM